MAKKASETTPCEEDVMSLSGEAAKGRSEGKDAEIRQEKAEIGVPGEAQQIGSDGERKKATADMELSATARSGMEQASSDAESGFYCYIGPNLKKLIQTGTIYRGTRDEAFVKAAAAIEAQPLVKTLIVSGDALPSARVKVKTPGNILYANYQKLAGKEGK